MTLRGIGILPVLERLPRAGCLAPATVARAPDGGSSALLRAERGTPTLPVVASPAAQRGAKCFRRPLQQAW